MIKSIDINRAGESTPSEIIISENAFKDLDEKLSKIPGDIFFITDDNVFSCYKKSLFGGRKVITFPAGEKNKNLQTVAEIERSLISYGANRDSFIVGVGGGIVTDVAGFCASTFMRGVRFGFIPTSLLAMVDASIGGKNGVNLDGYKNMVGTFRQPEWIIIDKCFLDTLPKREYRAGMAEVLKYALIYSRSMFNSLFEGDYDIEKMIAESAEIKAMVVNRDEKESGLRKVLNFGHTMAHAIEKCSNGRYLHGEAVAIGIGYIATLSCNLKLITENDLAQIEKVIESLGLPLNAEDVDTDEVFDAMKHDKKSVGKSSEIDEILLDGIGNFTIVRLDLSKLKC